MLNGTAEERVKTLASLASDLNDVREAKVFRAVYSNRQLEEALGGLWLNHFNVYETLTPSASVPVLLASYERYAIRPHARAF